LDFWELTYRHDRLPQPGHLHSQPADHPQHQHLRNDSLSAASSPGQAAAGSLDYDGGPVSDYLGGCPGYHSGALLLVHLPYGDARYVYGRRTCLPHPALSLRGLGAELREGDGRRGGATKYSSVLLLLPLPADGDSHQGETLHLQIHGMSQKSNLQGNIILKKDSLSQVWQMPFWQGSIMLVMNILYYRDIQLYRQVMFFFIPFIVCSIVLG